MLLWHLTDKKENGAIMARTRRVLQWLLGEKIKVSFLSWASAFQKGCEHSTATGGKKVLETSAHASGNWGMNN